MPASVCDSVTSALRLSLSADDTTSANLLDNRLLSSAKSVLLSRIEFEETGDYQSNVLDGLKSKYVVIRPKPIESSNKFVKKDASAPANGTSQTACANGTNGLPVPRQTLFQLSEVQLGWAEGAWRIGAGMQNVGNTCYLNSTLQALLHVPAFANWLLTEEGHTQRCRQPDSCVVCGVFKTLVSTRQSSNPIKPWQVYSKLRIICKHLLPGRQEDAHEFLRYLVEAMEKSFLSRFPGWERFDQYSKETTPLNQILGGYLRSAVRCLSCGHVSTTFQHFQDLLLDIRKPNTLEEALDGFFSRERLEDLGYKCESCNKKVSATKQFFIERAPMVLCIAFKRFSIGGGKLSKHIQFRKRITLQSYMFKKQQQTLCYRLSSLVCHLGASQHCGHYTACAVGPHGNALLYDDASVRTLQLQSLLATNAYIMFYEKESEGVVGGGSVAPCTTNSLVKLQNDYRSTSHDSDSSAVASTSGITFLKKTAITNGDAKSPKQNGFVDAKQINRSPSASKQNGYNENSAEKQGTKSVIALPAPGESWKSSGWKVSSENEKASPSTSINTNHHNQKLSNGTSSCSNGVNGSSNINGSTSASTSNSTLSQLQKNSHSGYGAPVSSWQATNSAVQKQVYEESRNERKRANESTDDMDRGRTKKVKHSNGSSSSNGGSYHRFHSNRPNYNPFQIRQDKQRQWGGNRGSYNSYNGERRSNFNGHRHNNYKHRRFHRYGNNHHFNRHHH